MEVLLSIRRSTMSETDKIKEIGAAAAKKAGEVLQSSPLSKAREAAPVAEAKAQKADGKKEEKADTVKLSKETDTPEKASESKIGDLRKNLSWLSQSHLTEEKKKEDSPSAEKAGDADEAAEEKKPGEKGSGILDLIKDKGGDALNTIKDKGGEILDTVKDKGGDALGFIKDLGGDIKDGLDKAGDAIKDEFSKIEPIIRSIPEIDATASDLTSKENNVLSPNGDAKPPRQLMEDGKLKVTSWNLHHGLDRENKDNQVDKMVDKMRDAKSDVYMLQEVPPWEAQKLADEMGMKAYYTRTTPNQGNMILVNPDMQVEGNEKMILNGDIKQGDKMSAYSAIAKLETAQGNEARQKAEPRVAQMLKVKTPDGKIVDLWNTHLTAIKDSEFRKKEIDKVISTMNARAGSGDAVVGGGDLNSGPSDSVLADLRNNGYQTQGASIDWITGKNTARPLNIVSNKELFDENDVQISDHPMVTVEI
jgi:endonuclease/exonuclease/phosphatase family metal-dependent hydrolase